MTSRDKNSNLNISICNESNFKTSILKDTEN